MSSLKNLLHPPFAKTIWVAQQGYGRSKEENMNRNVAFLIVMIIGLLMLSACSSSSTTNTLTPTPTPIPSPTPVISQNILIQAYSNGLPDYSYYPLELRGLDPELTKWIRPIIPAKIGPNNEVIATEQIRGVGLICEKNGRSFVISSSGPFRVASGLSDLEKEMEIVLGAVLAWNTVSDGSSERIIEPKEILHVVKTKTGEPFIDIENGLILLERINPGTLPVPEGCPFDIGYIDSLNGGHKLIAVGHTKGDAPELLMPYQLADVSMVSDKTEIIHFIGSTSVHDWGSLMFYLEDGKPKLIGILTGAYIRDANETRGFALSIKRALEIIYEQTGIQLGGT